MVVNFVFLALSMVLGTTFGHYELMLGSLLHTVAVAFEDMPARVKTVGRLAFFAAILFAELFLRIPADNVTS